MVRFAVSGFSYVRSEGDTVKVIPSVIGCLGGGMKRLKEDIKELFSDEKELE